MSGAQRIVYVIAFVIFSAVAYLPAQSYQILFESANRDYLAGQYDQAIEKYLQILENDIESGEVHFNLGNSYYKLDDYGRAILHYEKSKKFLGNDDALNKNLKLARLRIIDEIEPVPQLFLKVWWNEILNLLSLEILGWLTLFAFSCLVGLIALNILSIRKRNTIIWVFGLVFMIVLILFINKAYLFETIQFGIILEDKVSIVNEPNITGNEMFFLHEGTKVQMLRISGDWTEIKIADGKTGWLKTEYVANI